MRHLLAILFASIFVCSAQAQYLNISPQGLTAGSTPVAGCTSLQLFYNNAGVFGCIAGSSWNGITLVLPNISTGASGVISAGNYFSVSTDSGRIIFGAALDLILGRAAANNLRLGNVPSATPAAQSLSVQIPVGTNIAAAATFTIVGPLATGNATPGDIVLQTGAVGASGSTVNTPTTALTIKGGTQNVIAANSVQTTCTSVTGLGAAGNAGRRWCVNDQLTACPVLGGTFTNGGSVVCSAFDDGTNWTHQ